MKTTAYILYLFLLLSNSQYLQAQKGIFMTGGLEVIVVNHSYYTFNQQGHYLVAGQNEVMPQLVIPSITSTYLFKKHLGLSLGLQPVRRSLNVNDGLFRSVNGLEGYHVGKFQRYEINNGDFGALAWYVDPVISCQWYFNAKEDRGRGYISLGLGYNQLLTNKEVGGTYYYPPTNETLNFRAHFMDHYLTRYFELGVLIHKDDEHPSRSRSASRSPIVTFSIRYSFTSAFATADYTNMMGSTTQYADFLRVGHSEFGFMMRFGGNIFSKQLDKVYNRQYNRKYAGDSRGSANTPKIYGTREVDIKDEVIVHDSLVSIYIWDHNEPDGDVVSVALNDHWILQKDTLVPDMKMIRVRLDRGSNFLIMQQEDEGDTPTCSAAVMIVANGKKHLFILNSDHTVSETLTIKYVPEH